MKRFLWIVMLILSCTSFADDALTYDFQGKTYLRGTSEEVETKAGVLVFKKTGKAVPEQTPNATQTVTPPATTGKAACVT